MQTPLNKRVIGRHVGQKRKGSRAEQSKVSAEWTGAASEEHRQWNRLCNWSTQPVASIGYANDLPWQVAACLPQLPSLPTVHLPLCVPGASNVPLPALATCWVAVRQKLKPNNDFQSKQQLGRQATLRRLQLEQRFNAIRFDSGLVAKESHNSRPVIMRQMRAALAARHRRCGCRCCWRCQLYNVI